MKQLYRLDRAIFTNCQPKIVDKHQGVPIYSITWISLKVYSQRISGGEVAFMDKAR